MIVELPVPEGLSVCIKCDTRAMREKLMNTQAIDRAHTFCMYVRARDLG